MNYKKLLSKDLIENFKKISINNNSLSIKFTIFTYFLALNYFKNFKNYSTFFYIISFLLFCNLNTESKNENKILSEFIFLILNLNFVTYLIKESNLNFNTSLLFAIIFVATFINYSLNFNNKIKLKNVNLIKFKKLSNFIKKYIKNKKLKIFCKKFTFNILALTIIIAINFEKIENI